MVNLINIVRLFAKLILCPRCIAKSEVESFLDPYFGTAAMEMNKRRLRTLTEAVAFYRTRHRTPGCKITHMVGIPLLVAAPFVFAIDKRNGVLCGITGFLCQLFGHFFFEKNVPTIVETRDPMIIPAAIVFTAQEWRDVIQGNWIADNGTDLFAKSKINNSALELSQNSQTANEHEGARPIFIHSKEH